VNFHWPKSRAELAQTQRYRRRLAVEMAKRSRFYKGRLDHIDLDRLDDPDEWNRIPLLTKDELRKIPADGFHDAFCVAPRGDVVEYWRSGGVTGRPLFYPRSAIDMDYALLSFRRAWALVAATADDCVHISFPLGIHPVGHLFARTAEQCGIGTVWCGSGNNTPSEMQLDLIRELRPTIWAGMASYGLHLANLAEAKGIDLSACSVEKIIVAAEPLSPAKREKLERMWGAEVFDHFGMTEAAFVGGECARHDGLYIWSDLFFVEVVDEGTGQPVGEGETGSLVVTPLFNNTMTPFLRWCSGDLVSVRSHGEADGPWSIFPVMQHARRTVGFFKIRGVNINHSELEDMMFRNPSIVDFKAEAVNADGGLDGLHLVIEVKRELEASKVVEQVAASVFGTFESRPRITVVEPGTIGREFESSVKAARFVDRRG
jgi:phenylacetate-CoA ligase